MPGEAWPVRIHGAMERTGQRDPCSNRATPCDPAAPGGRYGRHAGAQPGNDASRRGMRSAPASLPTMVLPP